MKVKWGADENGMKKAKRGLKVLVSRLLTEINLVIGGKNMVSGDDEISP